MKAVIFNAPWARARLKNLSEWYGLDLVFDEVVDVVAPNLPFQKHPTSEGFAVLDMSVVNQYKEGLTVFIAPYNTSPIDKNGTPILNRATPNGLYLPPLLPNFSRWEWWATRLFWDSPAIQIFANEKDHVYQNGVDLGPSFELWLEHEFSHLFYGVIQKPDRTHEFFYQGKPELAREEILKVLKPHIPVEVPPAPPKPEPTPEPAPSRIASWALAIQDFEGYYPPGSPGFPTGSKSWRNKNPGNIKGLSGAFIQFATYAEGFEYLCDYLKRAATGKHAAYPKAGATTLVEFFRIYAPDPEPIPTNYAASVAKRVGCTPETPIGELV